MARSRRMYASRAFATVKVEEVRLGDDGAGRLVGAVEGLAEEELGHHVGVTTFDVGVGPAPDRREEVASVSSPYD